MGLLDQFSGILRQYAGGGSPPNPEDAMSHYQQVAAQAPPDALSGALAAIFRSPQTGTFGQNIASMFGQSDPNQRAGILNALLASGAAAGMLSKLGLGSGTTQVSPQQAQTMSPGTIESAVNDAHAQDPSILNRASEFYAQHPALVKAIGAGAAVIAMQHLAKK